MTAPGADGPQAAPPHTESGTPHPDAVEYDAVGREQRAVPPGSVLEAVVSELLGAVPEVRDALLSAADSLFDAARALIDAAERALHQGEEPGTTTGGEPGPHA
jgi:hypothetical protein